MTSCVGHEPCPKCNSSDNLARYDDGHGFCFGCEYYEQGTNVEDVVITKPLASKTFTPLEGVAQGLPKRGITQATCEKLGYFVADYKGGKVQVANYCDPQGRVVAQKVRFPNKDFLFLGDATNSGLYGQHVWRDGGKMVVITEGEIDALSVSQAQGNKWPVVSIPKGAKAAKKELSKQIEWLERFETVVLMFDMDEPGQAAVAECAPLFSPGKLKVAKLPLKDANELLQAGRSQEIIEAIWGARPYRPDGVVSISDIDIGSKIKPGLSWPWSPLTEGTYGIRLREMYTLGAGTGMGKSEVYKAVIAHLIKEHGQTVGAVFMEESTAHTVRTIAGKIDQAIYHVPDVHYDETQLKSTVAGLDGKLYLYDHFGHTDYDTIKARLRYMVVSLGCQWLVVDHLTALVSGDLEGDERKQLAFIMTDLSSLIQELNVGLFLISHLATPEGKPHEEGGRVMLRHFHGSRAIGQWSNYVFGLERNQQAEGPERHITTFRVLKDRYTGRATGLTFGLHYDHDTGCLAVHEGEMFGDDAPTNNEKSDF